MYLDLINDTSLEANSTCIEYLLRLVTVGCHCYLPLAKWFECGMEAQPDISESRTQQCPSDGTGEVFVAWCGRHRLVLSLALVLYVNMCQV